MVDVILELESYGVEVLIHDPVADVEQARDEYGIDVVDWNDLPVAEAIVLAVAHAEFLEKSIGEFASKLVPGGYFIDVKAAFDVNELEEAGMSVWRL